YLKAATDKPAPKTVELDQKGLRFVPHVLALSVGDTVNFQNSDSVMHDIYSMSQGGFALQAAPKNTVRSYTFKKPGAYRILCHFHPEMLAIVYVAESGHAAAVDRTGRFSLEDVPPGTYEVMAY